jgi:carbamoyl-phosphate synthase small subunit
MNGYIALENGAVIRGSCKSPGRTGGEIVFTTAYTGYEESLTDPSYKEQILTFSYTLIGNYGVRNERFESQHIQPEAAIARQFTTDIKDWFDETDKPAIDGVETRQIITAIREQGAMKCGIAAGADATPADAENELGKCVGMSEKKNINEIVAPDEKTIHQPPDPQGTIGLIDCGAKQSIITELTNRSVEVHQIPCTAVTTSMIRRNDFDVMFISNGPGDPKHFTNTQTVIDDVIGEIPVAGICLGQQILAEILNGDTEKMEFGHRGVNQPVMDLRTKQVMMTTQNHGYTVSNTGELTVTQENVNDNTVEGVKNNELQVIARQYHPEASPGPHDSLGFFNTVLDMATTTTTKTKSKYY